MDTSIYSRAKSPIVTQIQRAESPHAVASFNCLGMEGLLCDSGSETMLGGRERESNPKNIDRMKEVTPPTFL